MARSLDGSARNHNGTDFIDCIPANAAMIDSKGILVAVNENWHRMAQEGLEVSSARCALGGNYIDAWHASKSLNGQALQIATRLTQLVKDEISEFSMIYSFVASSTRHWFRIIASQPELGGGAAVLIFSITPAAILADNNLLRMLENSDLDGLDAATSHLAAAQSAPPSEDLHHRHLPDFDHESSMLFNEVMPIYLALVRKRLYNSAANDGKISTRLQNIGLQLAVAGVDAGFVLRLHIESLRVLKSDARGQEPQWIAQEARMNFISLLGFLANSYRDTVLAKGTDDRATS